MRQALKQIVSYKAYLLISTHRRAALGSEPPFPSWRGWAVLPKAAVDPAQSRGGEGW